MLSHNTKSSSSQGQDYHRWLVLDSRPWIVYSAALVLTFSFDTANGWLVALFQAAIKTLRIIVFKGLSFWSGHINNLEPALIQM